jgi:hypothetical protein
MGDVCGLLDGQCQVYLSCYPDGDGGLTTAYGPCAVDCLPTGSGDLYCTRPTGRPITVPDAGGCVYQTIPGTVTVTEVDLPDAGCADRVIVSWAFAPDDPEASVPDTYRGMAAGRGTVVCPQPFDPDAGTSYPETLELEPSGSCAPVYVEAGPSFLSCPSGC